MKRYFVNLATGGYLWVDAALHSRAQRRFNQILAKHGFEEVEHEEYVRLMNQGKIGERAAEELAMQNESEAIGSGLDDFTAIDGVGPVMAQKLHDLGLYTYQDLRGWLADRTYLPGLMPDRTVDSIRRWLNQRLV
jgi:predicted flap endonuclease-1-like 5' DNA nuclease